MKAVVPKIDASASALRPYVRRPRSVTYPRACMAGCCHVRVSGGSSAYRQGSQLLLLTTRQSRGLSILVLCFSGRHSPAQRRPRLLGGRQLPLQAAQPVFQVHATTVDPLAIWLPGVPFEVPQVEAAAAREALLLMRHCRLCCNGAARRATSIGLRRHRRCDLHYIWY